DYPEDACLRVSGIFLFWGFVGLVRSLFVGIPEDPPPRLAPDGRPGGQLALTSARWVEQAEAARPAPPRPRVSGCVRMLVIVPLALFGLFCGLLAVAFL